MAGPRNILLITADQFRWDALGCAGNPCVRTPHYDALAKNGVRFANAMTPAPICVPARAAITTGNIPLKCTGFKYNNGAIKPDQEKIAEYFNAHGYETYALGKLHYKPYQLPRVVHGFKHWELTESGRILNDGERSGKDLGGEEYFDYLKEAGYDNVYRAHGIGGTDAHPTVSPLPLEHYPDTWVLRRSIHHLKQHVSNHAGKPFFMWTSFPKPHPPFEPAEPYHNMYDLRVVPSPYGCLADLDFKSPELKRRHFNNAWHYMSQQVFQLARARYFGMISLQDALVGELMEYLGESGLDKNTSILFTSDHGEMLGDFGLFFKSCMLNGSVRIPFIISSPFIKEKGCVNSSLVGLEDVLPTLAALAGIPVPTGIDGVNLLPHMADPSKPVRDLYVSLCQEPPIQRSMAFNGAFKYIYSEVEGYEELYDLKNDPNELRNVARESRYAGPLKELRDALIAWAQKNGDKKLVDAQGKLAVSPHKPDENQKCTNYFADLMEWGKH